MLRYLLDLTGVAVFAISGAIAAGRRGMDLIGVIALAVVTAIGGGTIRDVLLSRHPIFWLADPAYLIVIVASSLVTVAYARWRPAPRGTLLVADALGLALFSVIGAQIAEAQGLPAVSCILLGTVTGTAGGVVRDVLSAEVPLLFRGGNLYASAAIAGTSAYFLLEQLGVSRMPASYAAMVICGGLRFAAIWWGLKLPTFSLSEERAEKRP
ncbi:MAG: trimeric intracellular cation channel family protein [bacterium]